MTEHRLSTADVRRALYIDFEGNKDQPPVLLGVHRVGRGEHQHLQQDGCSPRASWPHGIGGGAQPPGLRRDAPPVSRGISGAWESLEPDACWRQLLSTTAAQ